MKNEKNLLSMPFSTIEADIAPPEIKKKKRGGYTYTVEYTTYGYTAAAVENGSILEVTVFNYERQPEYRVFIGDHDYIAQIYEKGTWRRSTAKISSQYKSWRWCWAVGDNPTIFTADEENRAAAVKWLGVYKDQQPDVFRRLSDYLDDIGSQKLSDKHERIRRSVDEAMLQIRPLPERFEKWVDEIPFRDERYIMYQYSGRKKQDGFCSHCGEYVQVEGAKHLKKGRCPNCKSIITYTAAGKTSDMTFNKTVIYVQPGKDGETIFRYFTAWRNIDRHGNKLLVYNTITESNREFYLAEKRYEWGSPWAGSPSNWCRRGYDHVGKRGYIYPYNIKRIMLRLVQKYPHLKYIPYIQTLKNIGQIPAWRMYTSFISERQIEYLVKFKLYSLCIGLIRGSIPTEISENLLKNLKLKKQDIKIIQKYNMDYEEIKDIYKPVMKREPEVFPQILEMSRQRENYSDSSIANIIELMKYMSFDTIMKYIDEQLPAERERNNQSYYDEGNHISHVTDDWCDYIENCIDLGWNIKDTKVIRPKNLIERHDMAMELVKLKKSEIKARKIQQRFYENIFDLYYASKDYTVTLPHNIKDLKYEGDNLHHCVYTNYASEVAEGRSIIVFIRENGSFYKPLATAEIDPETYDVIQIRGEGNRSVSKEVSAFFEQYKRKILKKLKTRKAA